MKQDFLTAIPLLLLLAASLEAGFRVGRRAPKKESLDGEQVAVIQAATLGLLALLLGFSFAGAAQRFIEKQDLIVQEANAIGTAYLRADMLDEPHRSNLKTALANYVDHRIKISPTLRYGIPAEEARRIEALHEAIWKSASEGVLAKPPTMVAVLPPVNDVIDLHATRLAAARKKLPTLVLVLLVVCSSIAMMDLGFGCGMTGRRFSMMSSSLAVLIAASLWSTLDMDNPRAGLIRLNDAPLVELANTFRH